MVSSSSPSAATGRPPCSSTGARLEDYLASLAELLAPVVRSHRYTMRGLSPSPTNGPFTVARHVDDAVAILDGIGLDRAVLIGHSWGGFIAAAFGVIRPDRAKALVMIDSTGITGDGGIGAFGEHFDRAYTAQARARIHELDALSEKRPLTAAESTELAQLDWPHYHADPAHPPPFLKRRSSAESGRDGMADTVRLLDERFFDPLARRDIPTLVIGGAKGPFPTSVLADTAAHIRGGSLVVLPNAGHFPWYEQPEELLDAVRRFLSNHSRSYSDRG